MKDFYFFDYFYSVVLVLLLKGTVASRCHQIMRTAPLRKGSELFRIITCDR